MREQQSELRLGDRDHRRIARDHYESAHRLLIQRPGGELGQQVSDSAVSIIGFERF
jgi:hypothetical protein